MSAWHGATPQPTSQAALREGLVAVTKKYNLQLVVQKNLRQKIKHSQAGEVKIHPQVWIPYTVIRNTEQCGNRFSSSFLKNYKILCGYIIRFQKQQRRLR